MIKVGVRQPLCLEDHLAKYEAWRTASQVRERFVLVHYPDVIPENSRCFEELLTLSKQLEQKRLLIDTFWKNGRSTFEYYAPTLLRQMIAKGASMGIDVLVAGSLKLSELVKAYDCGAKIIGIRSAVCFQDSRVATLDPDKLELLSTSWIEDF